jgi:hypothetical protein
MWIPDPRWEEPNLLIPGKKPAAPTVIDWDNPITRGLLDVFVAPTRDGLASVGDARLGVGAGGVGYVNSAGSYFLSDKPRIAMGQDEFTIAAFFQGTGRGSINGARAIYSERNEGREIVKITTDEDGGSANGYGFIFRNRFNNLIYLRSQTVGVDTDFHSVFGLRGQIDGALRHELYVDGKYEAGTATAFGNAFLSNPGAAIGNDLFASSTSFIPSPIYMVGVWSRPLFAEEIKSLHRSPYQFLIPA